MKNGLGRFSWANGTAYEGHFKDNAMNGFVSLNT